MSVDVSRALQKATGRAKSDVANKLVSMFLHEVSRKVCLAGGMGVSDPRYTGSVLQAFGQNCLYCGNELERDRVSVEHLDGMNRFRVGLHVPGNVAMACKRCNNEKRRDDQNPNLILATSGWESFLSHDGGSCAVRCSSCVYWTSLWPDFDERRNSLVTARERIQQFREPYGHFVAWAAQARSSIRMKIETLYRDCQNFATVEIEKLTSELNFDFSSLERPKS
jgi:hypothetical protein